MDPARRVLRGDLVIEDGEIVALGKVPRRAREEIKARGEVIDASGCAVIPGLVQAHVHLCQTLFRGMADELPLLPWLKRRIWPLEAAHDRASLRASARLGLCEMMRAGTTSILDMGTVHHHDVVFEVMKESGIRGFSGKAMMDRGAGVPRGLKESTKSSLEESHRLCEKWHGAADGLLGYAYAPRFILSCSERLMREVAEAARERAALMHTHAAEHADERAAVKEILGKDDIAALEEFGICGPQAVLAHGVQLTKREMKRLAALGTRIVHCPSANLTLASGIAQVPAMRDAGVVVGLGADGAPCNNRMDPWTELRQAALLAKVRMKNAAALPAMDALALATVDGARALGIDDEVGSLEPGKRADVAVVRIDDLHHEPGGDAVSRLVYAAVARDVEHVFVDGRPVVRSGETTTLRRESVLRGARREAKKLVKRARLR